MLNKQMQDAHLQVGKKAKLLGQQQEQGTAFAALAAGGAPHPVDILLRVVRRVILYDPVHRCGKSHWREMRRGKMASARSGHTTVQAMTQSCAQGGCRCQLQGHLRRLSWSSAQPRLWGCLIMPRARAGSFNSL